MKSWVFSVQNYPDSRPSVENCPAGKSPSLPRSSRCQGRSPALAGAERQRSALTAESRGAVFTLLPGRVGRTQQSLQSPIRRAYQRVMDQATVPVSRAPSLPGPGLPSRTARRLAAASISPNTRESYRRALRQVDAWRGRRPLDDATLAAPRAARSSPSPPSASAPAWSPTIRPEPPPNKARSPAPCSALTTARGEPQAALPERARRVTRRA